MAPLRAYGTRNAHHLLSIVANACVSGGADSRRTENEQIPGQERPWPARHGPDAAMNAGRSIAGRTKYGLKSKGRTRALGPGCAIPV